MKSSAWRIKQVAAGLCWDCTAKAENGKQFCTRHRKLRLEASKAYSRKHPKSRKIRQEYRDTGRQRIFSKILSAYGGICACKGCNETNPKFLTLDHINGGGHKHRKKLGGTMQVYRFIVKNNFPPDFQILCWNCNCGKLRNDGICPHLEVSMEGDQRVEGAGARQRDLTS